jgi:hypothetical protein
MPDVSGSIGRAYAEQWMKGVNSFSGAIEEAYKPYNDLVNGFNLEFLQDVVARDREAKQVGALNAFLEDQGWFIPPSLDDKEQVALLKMLESGDASDAVIQCLLEWCKRGGGREIVETASSNWAFSGREALLEQAFEAHEEGKYALSVPVFLSQAEGAYIGVLVSAGAGPKDRPGLFQCCEPKAIAELAWELPITDVILHAHLRSFSCALSNQFVKSVWTEKNLEDLRTRYARGWLSRHGVMHGIDKAYGSLENGVKTLFVLDVIRELLDRLQPKDDEGEGMNRPGIAGDTIP